MLGSNKLLYLCSVKPTIIQSLRVNILNQFGETLQRQFPVGTAIQLTCQGEVGSEASNVSINTVQNFIYLDPFIQSQIAWICEVSKNCI